MESKKAIKYSKIEQVLRYREQTGGCQRVEKMCEVKRYKLSVIKQISHRNTMHIIGDIISNAAITLYGDRWQLDLLW